MVMVVSNSLLIIGRQNLHFKVIQMPLVEMDPLICIMNVAFPFCGTGVCHCKSHSLIMWYFLSLRELLESSF